MDWYDNMNIIPWINMGRKFSCQWGGWSYPCNLFKPSLMKNQTHTHKKIIFKWTPVCQNYWHTNRYYQLILLIMLLIIHKYY